MKIRIFLLSFILTINFASGQSAEYTSHVAKADSLYNAKEYKAAALAFSEAFKSFGWKGYSTDRYNAACCWALANVPDSAFYQLERIVTKTNYTNYEHISKDPDLNSLHSDGRWLPLLNLIKKNKEIAEANFDKPLVALLDTVHEDDQKYRKQMDDVGQKFGWDSKEMHALGKKMHEQDSINLQKISAILDSRGWLGPDIIGERGNSALFLVIQHADLATQEKYLPMMREAVKNGKAQGSSLALLEDRVALRQGRMQIYGSQIGIDPQTQQHYVSPLVDPDNVDKRRSEVGLQSLADYVSFWQINWDVEQYKRDLPKYIEIEKRIK